MAAAVQQDRNTRGLSQCNSGGLIWATSQDRLTSVQSQDNQKNLPIIQLHSAGIQVNDQGADAVISEENVTGIRCPSS